MGGLSKGSLKTISHLHKICAEARLHEALADWCIRKQKKGAQMNQRASNNRDKNTFDKYSILHASSSFQ